ncbi:MAG: DUF4258 domain-containing protein [Chitinophagaceae bacterium]|nr:MAG: DUF4258 domain-containing protein [Chitinophagaceae bacterium]
MNKKYFYFIYLIAAILLLYWIKTNQRNSPLSPKPNTTTNGKSQQRLDRSLTEIVYSKHARCRMDCRQIDEGEVQEIWKEGVLNEDRIEKSDKGISYPLEGTTHDGQRVRIVFAPKDKKLVVVTVIDLDKEWSCDCS